MQGMRQGRTRHWRSGSSLLSVCLACLIACLSSLSVLCLAGPGPTCCPSVGVSGKRVWPITDCAMQQRAIPLGCRLNQSALSVSLGGSRCGRCGGGCALCFVCCKKGLDILPLFVLSAPAPARAAGTCAEPHPHIAPSTARPSTVATAPQLFMPSQPESSLRLFPYWGRPARPRSTVSPSLTAALRCTPPSSPGPAPSLRRVRSTLPM